MGFFFIKGQSGNTIIGKFITGLLVMILTSPISLIIAALIDLVVFFILHITTGFISYVPKSDPDDYGSGTSGSPTSIKPSVENTLSVKKKEIPARRQIAKKYNYLFWFDGDNVQFTFEEDEKNYINDIKYGLIINEYEYYFGAPDAKKKERFEAMIDSLKRHNRINSWTKCEIYGL